MTVRLYASSDAGAPALRGNTAGDIINLLDKCLVTGYGSKLPAGWTKPFTGTNVAVFKTGAGSNGFHLRVSEPVDATSYARARVRGYENMTDVNTGTGQFPTTAQLVDDLFWYKNYSGSTAANPRLWFIVASESFVILMIHTYPEQLVAQPDNYRECYMFGDLVNRGPSDAYACVIVGQISTSPNSSQSFPFTSVILGSAQSGLFMPRPYTGFGGSLNAGWSNDTAKSGSTVWGSTSSTLSYPHGPDGALLLSPVWVHQPGASNAAALRGTLPGVWTPLQNVVENGDVFQGQGDLAGKTFMGWRHYNSRIAVEISDTWAT